MSKIFSYQLLKKIYLLTFAFILLPPFAAFASFLNLNTLAKALVFVLFFVLVFIVRAPKPKENTLTWLFLIFFLSQSASVLTAFNLGAFLEQYEDLVFSALFFFVSLHLIRDSKDIKNIVVLLFAGAVVNLLFQALILLFPEGFLEIGEKFLHGGYLEHIRMNIERGRIYFESYDEVLIPFSMFFWVYERKRIKSELSALFVLVITAFSFISNFRTRFVMLAFSLISSLFVLGKLKKKSLIFLFVFPATIYFLYSIISPRVGFSVIERMFLESQSEDVGTILDRFKKWEKTTEIGASSPVLGVGLGNYFDHLDTSMKKSFSIFRRSREEFELAIYDPHGIFFKIFAETGFFGLFSFLALLIYFVFMDRKLILGKEVFPKIVVVSFWTLFIHTLFNPYSTIKFMAPFWLLRVIVEKLIREPKKFLPVI